MPNIAEPTPTSWKYAQLTLDGSAKIIVIKKVEASAQQKPCPVILLSQYRDKVRG